MICLIVIIIKYYIFTENIPEDCPATVFKGLALKILSGLCGDSQLVCTILLFNAVTHIYILYGLLIE